MNSTVRRRSPPPKTAKRPKLKLARISPERDPNKVYEIPIHDVLPSPENDKLYRPVSPADQEIIALAQRVKQDGIREPLEITLDNYIVSGHRRHMAARIARLKTVPCLFKQIRRADDIDAFVVMLREHNRQRDKSFDEKLREELVGINPHEAYESLVEQRRTDSIVETEELEIVGRKRRARITKAKQEMLDAIARVLEKFREFWPLSDRKIHYELAQNEKPLKHASKPDSTYDNTPDSYNNLTDLLTRARLVGKVPWEAIDDETRPVTVWNCDREPRGFIRKQFAKFLKGYWRDLMQSQPNHVEIVGEKNTIASILEPVAAEFCIPMTLGRGFCSLPPRHKIWKRWQRSGKSKLILLLVSDLDPEGAEIAHSFARSMRDDFHVGNIHAVKVALTSDQVDEYDLPPAGPAKPTSRHYKKFVQEYGTDAWELEALDPDVLQEILRDAIDSVIDREVFNRELEAEKTDAGYLEGVRKAVYASLSGFHFGGSDEGEDE